MGGFIQGLYRNPPVPCMLCMKLATIAGTLQVNFITLEKNRDKWINIEDVLKLDFFTQISRLITLVALFGTTALSIDQLLKDAKIMGLIDLTVKRMDPNYLNQMQMNVLDNLSQLTILWSLSPGASCHSLGVRAGTTVKRLLKISFETIDESKYTNTTTIATVLMSSNSSTSYLY